MNNYRFLEMRVDKHEKKLMTQEQLAEKLGIDRNRIQQLETSHKAIPKDYELKAYCDFFNTTSDYLLNLRDTKPVDENIAMISKVTGLTGTSIEIMKEMSNQQKLIINKLIERSDFFFIQDALRNYFRSATSTVIINGKEIEDEERKSIFEHVFIDYIRTIFINLAKDEEILESFIDDVFTEKIKNKYSQLANNLEGKSKETLLAGINLAFSDFDSERKKDFDFLQQQNKNKEGSD